jgi:hypothetical protein
MAEEFLDSPGPGVFGMLLSDAVDSGDVSAIGRLADLGGEELSSKHQRFHDSDYSTPARQIVDRCEERRLGVCWL